MSGSKKESHEGTCIFGEEDLLEVQGLGNIVAFDPGEIIYREGEKGSSIFFIRSGSIQTFRMSGDSLEEILSICGPGELIGDISAYGDGLDERFATAQALEKVIAIKLEQGEFLALSREKPHIVLKVLIFLSSKMRDSDNFRIRMLEKKNTQILRSFEELKNAQDELLKRERLAAVGNLASKIIHDIKGTITPMKVYSENLDNLPESARNLGIQTIRLSIERIMRICEELLEYVRGTPMELQKKKCSVRGFIEKEVTFFKSLVGSITIEMKCEYEGDAMIDDERMGRVLQNLLINAKDAMPGGGVVTITTKRWDNSAIIEVADTGCGVRADMKEKIFEPFVTVGKKKGTGLGLSISKKILEEHGGEIHLESTPGKGSTFSIHIPIGAC